MRIEQIGPDRFQIKTYPIEDATIGYIFRRKNTPNRVQKIECHHAECVLPSGDIVSYGYDPEAAVLNGNWLQDKFEKGLVGVVRSTKLGTIPTRFTDYCKALRMGLPIASLLLIEVSRLQAREFETFWTNLGKKYNRVSYNCSTACYESFRKIGLISRIFPPIVTPERLFQHLESFLKSQTHLKYIQDSGFVGLEPKKTSAKPNILVASRISA